MSATTASAIEELHRSCRDCTACPELVATRSRVVVGDVSAGARVVVLGEAPGAQEDATGRPFVGRSGQLLDRLLGEAGLPREQLHVLNTVKCRPPGNRTPTRAETAACRSWLTAQLALLQPELVVALGLSATRWFLGPTALGPVRGRVHDADVEGVGPLRVLPTWHPSGALRGGPAGEPLRELAADLRTAALALEGTPAR